MGGQKSALLYELELKGARTDLEQVKCDRPGVSKSSEENSQQRKKNGGDIQGEAVTSRGRSRPSGMGTGNK